MTHSLFHDVRVSLRLKTPFRDAAAELAASRFGMALFLIALGVLFVSTLIAVLVVRIRLEQQGQWPRDLPALPHSLWLSTLLLVASAATVQRALTRVSAGDSRGAGVMLATTLAIGAAFLAVQAWSWVAWSNAAGVDWAGRESNRVAQMGFFVLTGLHALHVVGGLIGLVWATRRALRSVYTPERHLGVRYCTAYWHFLGIVWVALYAFLMI